jgi:hypothetical protein
MAVVVLPELHPVVAAPWFEGTPPWPWPIADREAYVLIRLSGGMTGAEVGSILAQLVAYNQVAAEPTVEELLSGAIAADGLLLPGGLQATAGARKISPGCCCGLEGWREWGTCLESGQSPWLGHDPAPRIEWAGALVRVWSDGGLDPVADAFAIEFERDQFVAELGYVERALQGFLRLVADWAQVVGFSDPAALCRKLDACFRITGVAVGE